VLGFALALLLAAPAAPAKPPAPPQDVSLAAPPFEAHKVPKKDAAYFSEHFAQRLAANGIQVITPQQVTSVREMEKLRQLVGCPETSADCLIELGHMLGAQGVLRGTLGKVGESFLVDVRVYQASDGKVISARSVQAKTTEALVRALDQMATEVAAELKAVLLPKPPPSPLAEKEKEKEREKEKIVIAVPPPPPPPRPIDWRGMAWIPGAVGLAAGGAGGYFFFDAEAQRAKLNAGDIYLAEAQAARASGERSAVIGTALAVTGGALLVGAGAMFLFGAPRGPVSVTPTPTGVKMEVTFQ